MTDRSGIRDHITQALADLRASHAEHGRTIAAFETALHASLQQGLEPTAPISNPAAWLAAHRPGKPSRIDADDALRAFILARIDHLTFEQIVTAVAAHFPPERCTSRSALSRWWRRRSRCSAGASIG